MENEKKRSDEENKQKWIDGNLIKLNESQVKWKLAYKFNHFF